MRQVGFSKDILKPRSHGGKRRGAGRKRRVDEGSHPARPEIAGEKHPLHITVRLRDGLPSLRKGKALKSLRAFMRRAQQFGLRVNQFSVLRNHIHLIAEADGTGGLKNGMKSFNGRLGRWLRQQGACSDKYPRGWFKGRYDVQVLTHPRQMRNALQYVLLNASKHFRKCLYLDQFSSAASFSGWPELLHEKFCGLIRAQVMSLAGGAGVPVTLEGGLVLPRTWLGRVGWQRG